MHVTACAACNSLSLLQYQRLSFAQIEVGLLEVLAQCMQLYKPVVIYQW